MLSALRRGFWSMTPLTYRVAHDVRVTGNTEDRNADQHNAKVDNPRPVN